MHRFLKKAYTAGVLRPYYTLRSKISEPYIDCYIVSFPKSGRTWLRVFLAKFFSEKFQIPVSLEFIKRFRLHKKMPYLKFVHTGYKGKRQIKNTNKKTIFLVRDPRDVVVSYFFQARKREGDTESPESITDFIRSKEYGLPRIITFMNTWYKSLEGSNYLLLRYEDLKKDPVKAFTKVVQYINLEEDPRDATYIQRAVDYSSFENMRSLEKKNTLKSNRLKPKNTHDITSFKTRKGVVGGYVDHLSQEDIAYADQMLKKLNQAFGYASESR